MKAILRLRLFAWAFGALLTLWAPDARALCTLVCTCTVSTTNVLFGSFSPLSLGNTDSVGGVSVVCGGTAGLLIPLTIDISKGNGASYAARSMAYATNQLFYNLYKDSGHSMIFGDTTNGTVDASSSITLTALGVGPTVTVPIYGRVFGGQTTMVPGLYTDTIAVTLTYF